MRDCSVTGCELPHHGAGYCRRHYARLVDPNGPGPRVATLCAADGCEADFVGRGSFCPAHRPRGGHGSNRLVL